MQERNFLFRLWYHDTYISLCTHRYSKILVASESLTLLIPNTSDKAHATCTLILITWCFVRGLASFACFSMLWIILDLARSCFPCVEASWAHTSRCGPLHSSLSLSCGYFFRHLKTIYSSCYFNWSLLTLVAIHLKDYDQALFLSLNCF